MPMPKLTCSVRNAALAMLVALGAMLLVDTAQAGLLVSRKEIQRESRVQWIEMKRKVPEAGPQVQKYVQCVAYKLIGVLKEPYKDLPWEVIAFDSPQLNAFAMPGGMVGVYTGLLGVADTQDELATVLGHELAHLTQDHIMKRARHQRRADALGILGSAATGLPGMVQDATTLMMSLPYSRKQESEADRVGLHYMAEAGFDPRQSLDLWKKMRAKNRGNQPPEFLSDHPADDERLDALVGLLAPALATYNQARAEGKRPNCTMQ